jgi:hypothetical protein
MANILVWDAYMQGEGVNRSRISKQTKGRPWWREFWGVAAQQTEPPFPLLKTSYLGTD